MTRDPADGAVPARSVAMRAISAFPSEMTLLLVLLAAAVVLDVVFVAGWLAAIRQQSDCQPSGAVSCSIFSGGLDSSFTGTLLMLATPGLLLRKIAARRDRRGSVALEDSPFAGAAARIRDLIREAGITREPGLVLGPGMRDRVFVRRYRWKTYMKLGPELLARYDAGEQGRSHFTAVVRHEIAHLGSWDLQSYQLATFLRYCNMTAGTWIILGFVIDPIGIGRGTAAAREMQILLLTVVIEVLARSFLRVREHYADLAAAAADPVGLRQALREAAPETASRWRELRRRHPSAVRRATVIGQPGLMLAASPGYLFLAAVLAGTGLVTLQNLPLSLFPGSRPTLPAVIITALVIGVPLGLFLAIAIWRDAWRGPLPGRHARIGTLALVLAGGLILGSHLAPFTQDTFIAADSGIPLTPGTLTITCVVSAALCVYLSALAAAAQRRDPQARAISGFLGYAMPAAAVAGGWSISLIWAYSENHLAALQPSGTRHEFTARTMITIFGTSPYTCLAVAIAAGSLILPKMRRRHEPRHETTNLAD
jgi:hypothetical protein